jgi:hypothetical protein
MQTLLRLQRSLEAAPWNRAVLAEWQERFGQDFALLKPHLKPTGERAGVFPCPNGGGDGCPRQVHERDGGFVAVCGNVPAESVRRAPRSSPTPPAPPASERASDSRRRSTR